MKKRISLSLACLLAISNIMHACLNTISNNTENTYKIVEIKNENKDVKSMIFCPEEYLEDETKAHTITPGEEVSFGGHYVPTFVIYKQFLPDTRWHALLVVKQTRCGPRGPENKYLLMTDLLNRDLPGDYKPVYKFTLKKEPHEIEAESTNTKALTTITNQYQVILNLIDDLTQKIQETMSRQLRKESEYKRKLHPEAVQTENDDDASLKGEVEDGVSCESCKVPAVE
ncbi:MAG: hypothetical protein WD055_04205 [Candidatus Dependentiae bacterium]